jgi:peptidylprolyl isomerase
MPAMRGVFLTIGLCLALALGAAACGGGSSSASTEAGGTEAGGESTAAPQASDESTATRPKIEKPGGPPPKELEEIELVEGDGAEAKAGDEVTVQYVGVNYKTGEEFDASWDRGEPFTFTLGSKSVIPGWEQGVEGMKVGGRRELVIPPELGYGESGAPPAIPPNETLVFVVDLVEVE